VDVVGEVAALHPNYCNEKKKRRKKKKKKKKTKKTKKRKKLLLCKIARQTIEDF